MNDQPQINIEAPPLHFCPKCAREFKNAHALRVHHARKHTKGWDTGKNFRPKNWRATLEQGATRKVSSHMASEAQ